MSEFTDKQAKFASMVGSLLVYASSLPDIRVRLSWAYRSQAANELVRGHPRSLHMDRLAIDLLLDRPDGNGEWKWETSSEPYTVLGEYWEAMGGTWGGRFNDGGHFSLSHRGMR